MPTLQYLINWARRLAVLGCCNGALTAFGQVTNQGPVFTVLEENDLVVRTDRHYTQGIKLAYFQADGDLPWGAKQFYGWLPDWGFTEHVGKFGYAVGQNMFTPADISTPELLPDDRPYAGWLYAGFILHRRGVTGVKAWPRHSASVSRRAAPTVS